MHPVALKKKSELNFFQKMAKMKEFKGCETGFLRFERPKLIVKRLLGAF